jgi:hypothetical protein
MFPDGWKSEGAAGPKVHRCRMDRGSRAGIGFLSSLLLAAACAHTPRLAPAPEAQRLPDDPGAAVASAAGVRVTVRSQSWKGEPRDLESIVTPLYVSVENDSATAIRIRYRDFTLTSSDGLQSPAIPPLSIQRPGTNVVAVAPSFTAHRFLLLRPYGPFYPAYPLWDGPFDWDPVFYDQFYSTWEPPLPTPDMLKQALPEGVLQPGGRVAGFLYFRRLRQEGGRVIFAQDVIVAETGERLATPRIPLVLQ